MTYRYYSSVAITDPEIFWSKRVHLASLIHPAMGPIVEAVMGFKPVLPIVLGLAAVIRHDGIVLAVAYNGADKREMPLGHIHALRDEFRRLADHCKLNDDERTALFTELKKWVGKDLRPRDKVVV
jgi:hypothetical protein